MDDLSVIDTFLATFSTYIDSGFGLLSPDVAYLTTILIAIDITLAGLFWAMAENTNVVAQLIKKVLYVGFFAFIIGNFAFLSGVIFDSFAELGLRAGGGSMTAADLMRPGFVANAGFDAGKPLLEEIGDLTGPIAFFENFVTIAILFFAWAVVLLSFFILAVQLFITVLEFKLTTLAGFILVPFALWNKTTFLAERVLGNVITSGIKLMVLAIILGIGSTMFASLASAFSAGDVTMEQALSVTLAAVSIFGLGIFGPGIAAGLITGAPQLGAGAAVGTVGGLAAGAYMSGAGAMAAGRAAAGGASSAVKAGASLSGGASASYQLGKIASGKTGVSGAAAGMAGIARAGADSVRTFAAKPFEGLRAAYDKGGAAAFAATGGKSSGGTIAGLSANGVAPKNDNWAGRFEARQNVRDAGGLAAHTIRSGDASSGGAAPTLREREDS
ncbi:P-type conjugative transfer protein TrbL [Hyphococcus sp.]|uniref:P-type conjugative transfer protein TrbL n=1 Tax=Hyphococcus sp. TaxID=2038636 RepID=UPI003D10526B